MVSEILSEYIRKFENYFKIKIGNHISNIEKSIHIIAKYLMYTLSEDKLTDNENKLKQNLNIAHFAEKNFRIFDNKIGHLKK